MMDDDSAPVAVAAPSSVFLANVDDEADALRDDLSPSPPVEENMKPDLNPDYNIADVRAAIKTLYAEVEAATPPPAAATASSASTHPSHPSVAPFEARLRRFAVRESFVSVADTLAKVRGHARTCGQICGVGFCFKLS
jgi:hypothetical protein